MVILAFSSFEIGQPSLAFLAASLNLAWSAPGIFTFTCRCDEVTAKPVSSFSSVTVAVVSMDCAVIPALPSWAERAMLKQPAWAAAINSSGLVPGCDSKRVAKEYGVFLRTPLGELRAPLPSFSPPLQCALAFLCMNACSSKSRCRNCIWPAAVALGPAALAGHGCFWGSLCTIVGRYSAGRSHVSAIHRESTPRDLLCSF